MIYYPSSIYVADSPIADKGIFASEKIKAGSIICQYSNINKFNKILTAEEINQLPNEEKETYLRYGYQIGDNLFAGPTSITDFPDISIYINHKCTPNVYFMDELTIVSMRDIEPGEELTYDYATTESYEWPIGEYNPYTCKCNCHSEKCRGVVLPTDWMNPELQQRYDGYFIPYLAAKIRLNAAGQK
jgi:uncharacterized protein